MAKLPDARPPGAAPFLTRRPTGHVWSVDVVRLLTFSAVIAVHVIAYSEDPGNNTVNAVMMLLQFGREVFFCITGFVLVYSTLGKKVEALPFWRKRFPYVVVPYVAWSLIYYGVNLMIAPYPPFSWHDLGMELISGTAFYHLYFLLVTMQLYLVFPWLVRFVRATARRAGWVLGAVGVANLAWLAVMQYVAVPKNTTSWFFNHGYELLPTYSLYVLGGCYGALYLPRLRSALRRHPRRALGLAGAGVAVAMGAYAYQLQFHDPRTAGSVMQPAMTGAAVAAIIVLGYIGLRWADGPRRGEKHVALGSDLSFGVYLVHPLILTLVLNNGLGNVHQVVPAPLASLLAFLATVIGSTLFAFIARRTPLSLALTGRGRKARSVASSVPGAAGAGSGSRSVAVPVRAG